MNYEDITKFKIIEGLYKQGEFAKSASLLEKLIKKYPKDEYLINYLGRIYFFNNNYKKSEITFRKAYRLNQSSADTNFNLGNLYAAMSDPHQAIKFFKICIKLGTNNEHIQNNIGASYMAMDEFEVSIDYFENALKINENFTHALLNYAVASYQYCNSKLTHNWFMKQEFTNLNSYIEHPLLVKAKKRLTQLLQINNKSNEAHRYLALIEEKFGNIEKSEQHFEEAIRIAGSIDDIKGLAKSLEINTEQLEKSKDLIEVLMQQTDSDDGKCEYITKKINFLLSMNKIDEAKKVFNYSVEFLFKNNPVHFVALIKKDAIKSEIKDDYLVLLQKKIEEAIREDNLAKNVLSHLHYVKADILLSENNLDGYFENLNLSKQYKREFIEQEDSLLITFMRFDQDLLDKRLKLLKNLSLPTIESNINPIFVLGMPRSGTTLIEMILSNHHSVSGCGEVTFLYAKTHLLNYLIMQNKVSKDALSEFLVKLRGQYLSFVSGRKKDKKPFFVDKLPANAEIIDLLYVMFPKATFIYSDRDDMANAWSIYSNYFSADIHWVNSMDEIIDRKKLTLLHSKRVTEEFNIKLLFNHYSDLVGSPEDSIRKILEFCDLDFDPNCLFPEKNSRIVRTISIEQARQPIYKGSDDKWKKFDKYLGVFKKAFLN